MKRVSVVLYQFDELGDTAKEVARSWFKKNYPDDGWWDDIFQYVRDAALFLGIEITDIVFSGFWSQGDGASFTGSFRPHKMMAYEELHAQFPKLEVVSELQSRLKELRHPTPVRVEITRYKGRYAHSHTMDVECASDEYDLGTLHAIRDCMRRFADWIYSTLNDEYEWLVSDECVDESIRANAYWFTADGEFSPLG